MSEKKVKFTGDASDLLSSFEQIKKKALQISSDIMADAAKHSKNSKDQETFINNRLKAASTNNKINTQGAIHDLRETYEQRLKKTPSQLDRNDLEKEYKERLAAINKESKQEKLMIDILREILKTLQEESKEQTKEDNQNNAFMAAGGGGGGSGSGGGGSGGGSNGTDSNGNPIGGSNGNLKNALSEALEKSKDKDDDKEKSSVFKALTLDRLIHSLNQTISQVIHAKSSEDLIKPALEVFGTGIGMFGGSTGAMIGKSVAGHFGDAYNRHIQEREDYLKSNNRLKSLTSNYDVGGATEFGVNGGQFAQLQEQVMRSSNKSGHLGDRSKFALGLSKGYGVDQSLILQQYATDIFTKTSSVANMSLVVGELEKRGIITRENRLPLTEFIKSQTALISDYSKNLDSVNQRNISNTLLSFNEVGGAFSASDPRSGGLIQGIGNKLSNPSNDFEKAFNFGVLRQTMGENASLLDMLKVQENPFASDKGFDFFKNTIDAVKNRGGSQDNQVLSLKARFGDALSYEQIEKLLNSDLDPQKMGSKNSSQIKDLFEQIKKEGINNTTGIEQQSALISDAFVKGATDGVLMVGELFVENIKQKLKQVIKEEIKGMFGFDSNNANGKRAGRQ